MNEKRSRDLFVLVQGVIVNCLAWRRKMLNRVTLNQSIRSFSDHRFSLLTDSDKMTMTIAFFISPPYSFRHVTRAETRSILSVLAWANASRDRLR